MDNPENWQHMVHKTKKNTNHYVLDTTIRKQTLAYIVLYIRLYKNIPSNDIVNAASNISYRPLLETAGTGGCYRPMFCCFFMDEL